MRSRSRSSRSGSAASGSARGAGGCARAGPSRPTQRSGPVEGQSSAPSANSARRPTSADQRRLDEAAVDAAAEERRHGEHRQREHDARRSSRLTAVRPATVRAALEPGLDEHPVLERRADRATAGRDLRERVAGELGGDHRPPAARVSASRCSAHRQASVASWSAAIAPASASRTGRGPSTSRARRAGSGATRYSETAVIASQTIVRRRLGRGVWPPPRRARSRARRRRGPRSRARPGRRAIRVRRGGSC